MTFFFLFIARIEEIINQEGRAIAAIITPPTINESTIGGAPGTKEDSVTIMSAWAFEVDIDNIVIKTKTDISVFDNFFIFL